MAEPKVFVWANPYFELDHRGWLNGVVPMDPRHGAGSPDRVCARTISFNFEKRSPVLDEGRDDRSERYTVFFALDDDGQPTKTVKSMQVPYGVGRTYLQHVRAGALIIGDKDTPPLAELAKARAAAIKRNEAEWLGKRELPFDKWAEQYPLDADVAAFGSKATPTPPAALEPKAEKPSKAKET